MEIIVAGRRPNSESRRSEKAKPLPSPIQFQFRVQGAIRDPESEIRAGGNETSGPLFRQASTIRFIGVANKDYDAAASRTAVAPP